MIDTLILAATFAAPLAGAPPDAANFSLILAGLLFCLAGEGFFIFLITFSTRFFG
jgi:type IV secretory pathway VirB3-like protein